MLSDIKIAGVASYDESGERLQGLKAVNYIFGTNGSGKTSISRVVADPAAYPTCSLTWSDGRPLDRVVYNSDFTVQNFSSSTAPGIFTLGRESAETRQNIEDLRAQIGRIDEEIAGLVQKREGADGNGGKKAELIALRTEFETVCWRYKNSHDSYFADAFEGLRNNKSRFCDRVLSESLNNVADEYSLDDLKTRAKTVFEKGAVQIAELPAFNFQDLKKIEASPILAKKVVGKEDIDVSALIKRLGNSDWIKQGLEYIADPADPCPFCQQPLPHDLADHLNEYFDETYLADMAEIQRAATAYETYSSGIIERLEAIATEDHRYLDTGLLKPEIARLSDRVSLNARLIDQKHKEASTPVALEPIAEIADAITALIGTANESVRAHNQTVQNLGAEKAKLISQIWKCILVEANAEIANYNQKKTSLDQGIAGITSGIENKQQTRNSARLELTRLERSVTSVQPTVNQINGTLNSFGFSNFELATAEQDEGLYRIVRSDGSDASQTLSEGEKGFITFLYFYHMIRGSLTESGMNTDRIVVFDDPVSSLDSDVLFIVSGLIRKIVDEACSGSAQIKQVIVLTHNIYFHKEVCFDTKRDPVVCRNHETFWVVRKVGNHSKIVQHVNNPVKTSYELLWSEVKNQDRSKATIRNTLRRILENYFKILGNTDFNTIVDKFDGRDKIICASLFKWVHDGSHSFDDDLHLSSDESLIDRYLQVFREIFVKTDHMGHFRMMMGEQADVVAFPTPIAASSGTDGGSEATAA